MESMKGIVIDGNEIYDLISCLKNKDASDIEFRNCDFRNDEIISLANEKEYYRIAFINCSFENEGLIQNIKTKSLSLTDNKIINYEFIYSMLYLENLTIVGGKVDVSRLNNFKKLEYLRMSHSNVNNIDMFSSKNIKYLFIDNTNIKDISFIKKFPQLELLSISEEQELRNKELIKEISKHIRIIRDSIVEMEAI